MRIITWNINGARTLPQYHPWNKFKTWSEILDQLEASIICFQEMKSSRQQLERPAAVPDGYDAFFSFPVAKVGYSGVAVYSKRSDAVPLKAEEGLSSRLQPKPPLDQHERVSDRYPDIDDFKLDPNDGGAVPGDVLELDNEGRALVLDYGLFVLINLYCPAETNESRTPFKMNFHRLLEERVRILLAEGREVIVLGDINICAAPIDHCDFSVPSTHAGFYEREIRAWMRDWLQPNGPLSDVVRNQWPDRKFMYTCWNTKLSARDSNYGTRIDYVLCTPGLLPWIKHADIQPLVKGSDHCPVFVDLYDEIVTESGEVLKLADAMKQATPPNPAPRIAACNWDQFSGKQLLLSKFFGKGAVKPEPAATVPQALLSDTMTESQRAPSPVDSSQASNTATTIESSQASTSSQSVLSPPSSQHQPSSFTKVSATSSSTSAQGKKRKVGQMKMSSFFKQQSQTSNSASRTSSDEFQVFRSELDVHKQIDEDFELARQLAEMDAASLPPKVPTAQAKSAWSNLLAPVQAPKCDVHGEPATRRTTMKPGPNKGKVFYACSRPLGPGYDNGKGNRLRSEVDPQYKCNFFKWEADVKRASLRETSGSGEPSSPKRRKLSDTT